MFIIAFEQDRLVTQLSISAPPHRAWITGRVSKRWEGTTAHVPQDSGGQTVKSTMTTVEAFHVKMAARVKTERRHIGKVCEDVKCRSSSK